MIRVVGTLRRARVLLMVPVLAACAEANALPLRSLPDHLVAPSIAGLTIAREPKAEAVWQKLPHDAIISSGHVYTIHNGPIVEGDLQVAVFKRSIDTSDLTDADDKRCTQHPKDCSGHQALRGIQAFFGDGKFQRTYYDGQRLYAMTLSDQRIYLWLPPTTQSYLLLVLRKSFDERASVALVHALVDYEQGRPVPSFTIPPDQLPSPTPSTSPTSSTSPGGPA